MTNFISFDGKQVVLYEWRNVDHPKGVVQIIHGMAEHAARYEAFATYLNANGYIVVADDHRGHGRTDGTTLGYSKGDMFANTVRDEGEITDYLIAEYPHLKHFVLGFSYGSFITQSYLKTNGRKIDGVIIAGSNHKKDSEVYLGSFVASLNCIFFRAKSPAKLIEKLSFGAYQKQFESGDWLSVDEGNNSAYHGDPLCGFTCSYRFYKSFFHGLKKLYTKKYVRGLNKDLPMLLAAGADDPVGEKGKGMRRLKDFYVSAGVKQVELVLFENSRHEFLNERENRDEKWGTVLSFLNRIAEA